MTNFAIRELYIDFYNHGRQFLKWGVGQHEEVWVIEHKMLDTKWSLGRSNFVIEYVTGEFDDVFEALPDRISSHITIEIYSSHLRGAPYKI